METHGFSKTPEYAVWKTIKARCYRQTCKEFQHYGARGITMCDRWRDSFEYFISDMGWRPKGRYSIERINNDKGYSPDNCEWITHASQCNNRRSNHNVTFRGETHNIMQWSLITGIKEGTLRTRINKLNWSVEKALSQEIDHSKSTKRLPSST